jgi:hypothetical protein
MTQSSTPQDPNNPTSNDEHDYDPVQQQVGQQQQVSYDPYFNAQPRGPPQHTGGYAYPFIHKQIVKG